MKTANVILALAFFSFLAIHAEETAGKRKYYFAFSEEIQNEWVKQGKVLLVPSTRFVIRKMRPGEKVKGGVLRVEANSASGVIMTRPRIDPQKYPRVRWRWRVLRHLDYKPQTDEPDDQVITLYFGDGTMVSQQCVGYRWEYNTPIGECCLLNYVAGTVKVWRVCTRNRQSPRGKWIVEERNYAQDYEKAFGKKLKEDFVMSIGGNSQYTKSDTVAEIDYIEFLPAKEEGVSENASPESKEKK